METCIFDFCTRNYRTEDVYRMHQELYNVVKYIMDDCGINDSLPYSNIIAYEIIHAYLSRKITEHSYNDFCAYLTEKIFDVSCIDDWYPI